VNAWRDGHGGDHLFGALGQPAGLVRLDGVRFMWRAFSGNGERVGVGEADTVGEARTAVEQALVGHDAPAPPVAAPGAATWEEAIDIGARLFPPGPETSAMYGAAAMGALAADARTLPAVEEIRAMVVEIEPAHEDDNEARSKALAMIDALVAKLKGAAS
jgi:hypothetical protein